MEILSQSGMVHVTGGEALASIILILNSVGVANESSLLNTIAFFLGQPIDTLKVSNVFKNSLRGDWFELIWLELMLASLAEMSKNKKDTLF